MVALCPPVLTWDECAGVSEARTGIKVVRLVLAGLWRAQL